MEPSRKLRYGTPAPDRSLDAGIQPDMQAGAESLLAQPVVVKTRGLVERVSGRWAVAQRPVRCRAGSAASAAARRSRAEPPSTDTL